MTLLAQQNMFGEERAKRYKTAMDRCPMARCLEVLPLLCMVSEPGLGSRDLVDVGSGTGYVANFFEGLAHSVLRVDKSPQMLQASGYSNTLVSDMHDLCEKIGEGRADIVVSVGAFHHAHIPEVPDSDRTYVVTSTRADGPERYLDTERSLLHHCQTIRSWTRVLRPGGFLCLIDVPGYPDPEWDPFCHAIGRRSRIDTTAYSRKALDRLGRRSMRVDGPTLASCMQRQWGHLVDHEPILQAILSLSTKRGEITIADLLEIYHMPSDMFRTQGPMVPTDFFDYVLDANGIQRHFGYFLRESSMREALLAEHMNDVLSVTLPTPWLFNSTTEAAWFIHELFAIGPTWDYAGPPLNEVAQLLGWMKDYLGVLSVPNGRTLVPWQLCYVTGRKPHLSGERSRG